MIDIKKINDQTYLLTEIKRLNASATPILDISGFTEDQKKRVISAYSKFKFALDSVKTPIRLSILTEKIPEKTIELSLTDDAGVIEDSMVGNETPKKKKKE